MRKSSIRKLNPLARKVARLHLEAQSLERKLQHLITEVHDLELARLSADVAANFWRQKFSDVANPPGEQAQERPNT